MHISKLKKKYKNTWVLCEVIKEDDKHQAQEVKPIIISGDRNEVYEALQKVKSGAHVATIYTGKVPAKDMVFAFYGNIPVQSTR